MPSNLERLRELKKKQDEARGSVPAEQATVCVPKLILPKGCSSTAPPKTVKIDQADKPKYTCGHDVHTHGNCPACAQANRIAKRERNQKNREAREAKGEIKPDNKQRLPDGAIFHVTYRAETTSWSGSLTIPGCPPFESNNSGVFQLLSRLDFLYRAWLQRGDANPTDQPCTS